MRFLVAFFFMFFSVQALTTEEKSHVESYFNECGDSSGIVEENVMRIKKGDFNFDDKNSREFILCMFKKVGIMSEAGVIQRDSVLSKIDESLRPEITRIVDLCVKEQGPVAADQAWNYAKCYEKERPGQEDFF